MSCKKLAGIAAVLLIVSTFSVSSASVLPETHSDQGIDSSYVYVDFDTSMYMNRIKYNTGWLKNDKYWLATWKKYYEEHNPSRVKQHEKPLIPKIIHQIWLGSSFPEKYKKWQQSWLKCNPGWEYKLWTDADVKKLTLHNRKLFDAGVNYGQKVSILRYEILYQFGGLYVDTDFECFKSFDVLNHSYDFYTSLANAGGIVLCNALIGAAPGHPLLKKLIEEMNFTPRKNAGWRHNSETAGPIYLSKKLIEYWIEGNKGVMVFPDSYFYPIPCGTKNIRVENFVKPESFAAHYYEGTWLH